MHPTSIKSESERELLDLHFHRRPVIVPGFQGTAGPEERKSKDKGKRPIQRRIAKGNERPPDHQAKRRSRKETHPFPSGATRRERVIGQHEENAVDEDSQESQTSKTCTSYEKKPATTKKLPKKQRQLLKQVPTRNPYREGNRGNGATWTPPAARYHSPLEDDPRKIQQSETERNEVSDPLEHKVSITQDIPLSRERTGEGLT